MTKKEIIVRIEEIVCEELDVDIDDYRSDKTDSEISFARFVVSYILYTKMLMSLIAISKYANVNIPTIHYRMNNVRDKMKESTVIRHYIKCIEEKIQQEFDA